VYAAVGMSEDEFLRKYHPVPALLNLMSSNPKTDSQCPTKYDMLHPEIVDIFQSVRKHVKTGNAGRHSQKSVPWLRAWCILIFTM